MITEKTDSNKEIVDDIQSVEQESDGIMDSILGGLEL